MQGVKDMNNSIQVLLGSEKDILKLFPNIPTGLKATDFIGHTLNQTLQRDMFFGSWADVFTDNGEFGVKITSPGDDVSSYCELIPAYFAAAKTAYSIFEKAGITDPKLHFLLPFGLCMARTQSIQLLHFPPTECLTYMDYLYSPTNRRWESLLGYSGYDGTRNTRVERIVDVVPIAAPGGDSTGISPYNNVFASYGKEMLKALLSPDQTGKATQPVVAYGGPVRDWLESTFPDQIREQIPKGKLDVLSVVSLPLYDDKTPTPVLCANHPSMYFYLIKKPYENREKIMKQDLVAAGWQTKMSRNRDADPISTRDELKTYWDSESDKLKNIIESQDTEFGWAHKHLAPPVG